MRSIIILILLMFSLPPAFAETFGEQRQYSKDWLTACRSDLYCSATAYVRSAPANGTVADYVLRIGRHAEETFWEISLTTIAAEADARQDFTISLDGGRAMAFSPPAGVAPYGSINDFYFLGSGAHGLLDAMVKGRKAAFSFKDKAGQAQTASFPLAGLAAALIAIDTKQHRIGSERVAEAPPVGLQPAGAAAPAAIPGTAETKPAANPLTEVPPVLRAQFEADSACDVKTIGPDQLTVADLGGGDTLFIVPCTAGPSYTAEKAYLGRGGAFEAVAFPQYLPSIGWLASPLLFNASIDADALIVTSSLTSVKGDCGMSGQWAWTKTPLYADHGFRLVEFRAKEACDGKPGDFPEVYPPKP